MIHHHRKAECAPDFDANEVFLDAVETVVLAALERMVGELPALHMFFAS